MTATQGHIMPKLTPADLLPLETYAKARSEVRAKVMAHKKSRTVHLGDHVTLIFEDSLTISYQVQEMLRVERIFEQDGIQEELDAYNPLIPDGSNWKATMMIEYPDVDERQTMLARLKGIENRTWVRVAGFDKVHAIADEDLERENEEKTSSVHFLRFELTPAMIAAVKQGAAIGVGVEHPEYTSVVEALPDAVRASLAGDLAD
jgi:hypothetical protein